MVRVRPSSISRAAARGCALLLLACLAAPAVGATPERAPSFGEAHVAAFARLFGVVRYFYPSDAAAELDWQRLAIHGVARVRAARDRTALREALDSLFSPLGPGIVVASTLPAPVARRGASGPLVAWQYLGPGFINMTPYSACRLRRALPPGIDGFVTLMQSIPADGLRGQTARLRAQVRAAARDSSGQAALWLRVDRPGGGGYFDNMADRPIRDPQWREYALEGPVAGDAVRVAFGVMASGTATADFDQVQLATRTAQAGEWKAIPVADPGFEAVALRTAGWARGGSSTRAVVEWPAGSAPEGERFLRLASPPVAMAKPLFDGPTLEYVDVDLRCGLRARVPLALTDSAAKSDPSRRAALQALHEALQALPAPVGDPDLDTRLADVVVAWNVYRHFYPYWPEVGVDWEARLPLLLEAARSAGSRAEHRDALRRFVAEVRDGHGRVRDVLTSEPQGTLPLQLGVVEGQVVITASARDDLPVGSIVTQIDGEPALTRIETAAALASGSPQWRRTCALREMQDGPPGTAVRLRIDDGKDGRDVALQRSAAPAPAEKRPQPVVELLPGISYVDLTRATMADITPALERLASARSVVFDVRGYPTEVGMQLLPRLIDAAENDRWMHVAKIVGPFGRTAGWQSMGWDVRPATPRIRAARVFLTDSRAISYAESVLGYVADRHLGRIVGGPTAGANGNVASFQVPSGFSITFTGMRVTRHDGRTPFHALGLLPDVPVSPTIAGLRAGRDEVLERGLDLLRTE